MKNNRPFFPGRHQASAGENLKLNPSDPAKNGIPVKPVRSGDRATTDRLLYLRAECSLAPLSVSAPALQASGTAGFLKNETM